MKNLILAIITVLAINTLAQAGGDNGKDSKQAEMHVLLYDENGDTQKVQYEKNEDGEFEFNNLRPGNYKIGLGVNDSAQKASIYVSEKRCETGLGTIVLNYEWNATTVQKNSRAQRVNICQK